MPIHTTIQTRRKALGLTQEQVAAYLGVTTPAVNKWERGVTCPDISLLAPLARLLKTDLNDLLDFQKELTPQEISLFCSQIQETCLSQGFAAGFALAQERVREFSGSETLLYNLILLLPSLMATADLGEEEHQLYDRTVAAWSQRLAGSEEPAIRNGVHFMLASRALNDGDLDAAQMYLDRMPNRNDTPDKRPLQASLYRRQGETGQAVALLERTLLAGLQDLQMVLYQLIDAQLELGDAEAAAYTAQRTAGLADLFDLNRYSAAVALFQIAVAQQDTAQTVSLLRTMLEALSGTWDFSSSPLYKKVEHTGAETSAARLLQPLLQGLQQDPAYAYLQNDPDFRSLLQEFASNSTAP